jgi:CRP-like cAMP-binding protein
VLQDLAGVSSLRAFAKREVVLDKSAQALWMFFLLEGRLQATDFTLDGKEVCLYFVEEGEAFGQISVIDGLHSPEILIANKKSQVVMVPGDAIRPLILSQPQITETVLLDLAGRIRVQSEQRQILSINNPLQRVCGQLLLMLRNSRSHGGADSIGMQALALAPTHQELAMMVNLSRETVTRVFQVLQAREALERQGDLLMINAELLQQLANSAE